MQVCISQMEVAVAETMLTNEELSKYFKALNKIDALKEFGLSKRPRASTEETPTSLAMKALDKLSNRQVELKDIDSIIFCTQSPDYKIPNCASIIHSGLNLSSRCKVFDIAGGCTGLIHGFQAAKNLVVTKQAQKVLVISSDIFTKIAYPQDLSSHLLFGDGAFVCLIENYTNQKECFLLEDFQFDIDSKYVYDMWMKPGGDRYLFDVEKNEDRYLKLNGLTLSNFLLRNVPIYIKEFLQQRPISSYHKIIFQPTSRSHVEMLSKILNINNFFFDIEELGYTGSSSIGFMLERLYLKSPPKDEDEILVISYGSGYSCALMSLKFKK